MMNLANSTSVGAFGNAGQSSKLEEVFAGLESQVFDATASANRIQDTFKEFLTPIQPSADMPADQPVHAVEFFNRVDRLSSCISTLSNTLSSILERSRI